MDFQIGRLHPLLVHLPIGILLLAFLFEVLSRTRPFKKLRFAIRPALGIGTLAALASVVTGLYLADLGAYDERILRGHKYLGIATAALAVLIYVHRRYAIVPDKIARKRIRLALFIALTFFIVLTGHFGGSLTHGNNYLFPDEEQQVPVAFQVTIPDPDQAVVFDDIIQPLLKQKCMACHGPIKQKGELRLDSWESIQQGGKHGEVWRGGEADHSLLFKRVALPIEEKEHMPPRERQQLSNLEVEVIRAWIAEGASRTKRVSEFSDKTPIMSFIQLSSHSELWEEPESAPDEAAVLRLKEAGVLVLPLAANSKNLVVKFLQVRENDMADILKLAPQIVAVDLSGCHWNEGQLAFLPALTRLKKLSLQRSSANDRDAMMVGQCPTLEILNVSQTKITQAGVSAWKNLSELKRLYVYGVPVSKPGLDQLRTISGLRIDTGNYILPILPSDTVNHRRPRK
ncbi:MAG TPA: hypothetical protein PLX35_03685 [Cyclobacteriaceae bacterium]|nr:hypothetical protein [Cyclobacteriaceae bacterium]